MKQQCMVVLVENNSGVLTRVTSLFMQRGFNIDSLTVSSTDNPHISRITIVTTGDTRTFSQIMKQTGKLVEVKLIFSVEPQFSIIRELLLVKFYVENGDFTGLEKLIADAGASVADVTSGCLVAQMTDTPQKIDEFLESVKEYKIMELCRSGATALERGKVYYDIN